MKLSEQYIVTLIAVVVLSLLGCKVYAQENVKQRPTRDEGDETRSEEIARLAWYIEIGNWELKSQSITDVNRLVRANQGQDMTDFVPVVKPLIANIGWGGIARGDTQNAVESLVMIGEPAVPALIDTIVASEARLRWASAEVLTQIRRDAGLVIMLAPLAEDKDPYVRIVYYRCLGSVGEAAKHAIPLLLKAAAEDPVPKNRFQCLRALVQITDEAEPHVADIAAYLKHEDPDVRRLAVRHLGDCGSLAQSCMPELLQSLKDTDAQVRIYAASSLEAIGAGSTINPESQRSGT